MHNLHTWLLSGHPGCAVTSLSIIFLPILPRGPRICCQSFPESSRQSFLIQSPGPIAFSKLPQNTKPSPLLPPLPQHCFRLLLALGNLKSFSYPHLPAPFFKQDTISLS